MMQRDLETKLLACQCLAWFASVRVSIFEDLPQRLAYVQFFAQQLICVFRSDYARQTIMVSRYFKEFLPIICKFQ
jgi:hypothetical protein